MSNSDESNSTRDVTTKQKKAKLPWWVELLFVQIGLPEKHLRSFLKLKGNASIHLEERKGRYFISLIILMGVIYINPLITNSRINNRCVKQTIDRIMLNKLANDDITSRISMVAVNHCNGGTFLFDQ